MALSQIAKKHSKSIVPLLLDIQKYNEPQQKFLEFLTKLDCLKIPPPQRYFGNSSTNTAKSRNRTRMSRVSIDTSWESQYVALSYTWDPSDYEVQDTGSFDVQDAKDGKYYPSPVRGSVFHRLIAYMHALNLKLLWIDRHCIPQETCQTPCGHDECLRKKMAIHTMDLVYKRSDHPVALLGRPIKSKRELFLFVRILDGSILHKFRSNLSTPCAELNRALSLLESMTNDLWWTRAWTFQENYRAGIKMTLLIPHPPPIEKQKRAFGRFGEISGELCVKSVDFAEAATQFCLAFRRVATRQKAEVIDSILRKAAKYTILLAANESMFPYIVADLSHRNLTNHWDRLAITANCCQYPIHLDTQELRYRSASLSLSILAMCLINGEIFNNSPGELPSASNMTVFEYLDMQYLSTSPTPRHCPGLTYRKGCRFIDVVLDGRGINTHGHLWELGEIIHTGEFPNQLPWVNFRNNHFSWKQLQRLLQLIDELDYLKCGTLANLIERFLDRGPFGHPSGISRNETFGESHMLAMAQEVATAVVEGKRLRLGRLWKHKKQSTPYTAIFIWEETHDYSRLQCAEDRYVFTSSRPMNPGTDENDANDTDRHVCLEVIMKRQRHDLTPRLYTKRGLFGWCFFNGCPRTNVVFPWPSALESVVA